MSRAEAESRLATRPGAIAAAHDSGRERRCRRGRAARRRTAAAAKVSAPCPATLESGGSLHAARHRRFECPISRADGASLPREVPRHGHVDGRTARRTRLRPSSIAGSLHARVVPRRWIDIRGTAAARMVSGTLARGARARPAECGQPSAVGGRIHARGGARLRSGEQGGVVRSGPRAATPRVQAQRAAAAHGGSRRASQGSSPHRSGCG